MHNVFFYLNVNIPTHLSPTIKFGLRHSQVFALHRKFVPSLGQSVAVMHSKMKKKMNSQLLYLRFILIFKH